VKILKPFFYLLIVAGFISCEKKIDFDLNETEPKLVVEATIENETWPIVYLSNSFNYFSTLDPNNIQQSFIHNAVIYVSNGIKTHKLKEYEIPLQPGYSLFYYSIDSSNLTTAFKGELNRQYAIEIEVNGKEYRATTTIPAITKRIDSLWGRTVPGFYDPNKRALMIKATDPPGYGDYIRYFTRRNSEPFYPPLNSVFDDQIIDGTTYSVEMERGVDRNIPRDEGYSFFNKLDTVTVKLCNIDKTTFDFWRTMEFAYSSVGNPFSSPSKVLGNISGGALGYFGGYASQFKTVIIRD
jgi:Domain of unknown function (DUF4249)